MTHFWPQEAQAAIRQLPMECLQRLLEIAASRDSLMEKLVRMLWDKDVVGQGCCGTRMLWDKDVGNPGTDVHQTYTSPRSSMLRRRHRMPSKPNLGAAPPCEAPRSRPPRRSLPPPSTPSSSSNKTPPWLRHWPTSIPCHRQATNSACTYTKLCHAPTTTTTAGTHAPTPTQAKTPDAATPVASSMWLLPVPTTRPVHA